MLSRIFGYIRDVVYAIMVGAGAGPGADAFLVAFKIPNFMRRLFAEGGFSVAFVPVISEYRSQKTHDEVRTLAASVSGVLAGVLFVVTITGMLAAPVVITVFAPGFIDETIKFDLAVDLLRITFPYLFLISLAAFAGGILNTFGKFAVPAFTPVLLNLSIIACAFFLAPHFEQPVYALAWGVLLGGILQAGFQLPFLWKLGLLVWPTFKPAHEGVKRILKLMIPAMFGVSVSQINLLLDTVLASFLVTGSVSWLYFSDRLVELPLGVFGIALATAMLPTLSRSFAEGDSSHFSAHMDWGLKLTFLIGLPSATGLIILAGPTLLTLFQYGEFTTADVRMSSLSLAAYSMGLLGFMCVKVLAPGFFARQDTRTPVRIAIIAMFVNMVMNIMLIFTLKHVGLALATSLSSTINALLLFRTLRNEGVYQPETGWAKFFLQLFLATTAMALVLFYATPELTEWFDLDVYQRAARLFLWVAVGAAVYVVVLLVSGVRPADFSRKTVN